MGSKMTCSRSPSSKGPWPESRNGLIPPEALFFPGLYLRQHPTPPGISKSRHLEELGIKRILTN